MTPATLHFPYPVVGPPRPPPGSRSADPAEHETFLLHPPYDRLEFHAGWDELESRHLAPGSVAGIRVSSASEWPRLEPAVRQLRIRLPAAPVVLLFAGESAGDLFLSARAARGGVRAILHEGDRLQEGLRTALTCRDSLADDVVEWLALRRLRLSPMVASLLREIFARAAASPDLSTLLAQVGMAESSARFRLHKRLLPTPSRWFQAARALHSVMRVQAEPNRSLLRIAHEFGYADHSALSQLVHRSFRVRPGAVRGTLGWEWLMHRWICSIPEMSRAVRTP
jgi:methylphosphotriester-DNA--protein-cysteine methyltransferase